MDAEKLMRLRSIYYHRVDVQYELFRSHYHRETAFLDTDPKTVDVGHPKRWLRCDTVQYLLKNMDFYRFLERPMNLYHSLATVKFPFIDFRKDFREQQDIINDQYWQMMTAYDLGIDVDNDKKKEGRFNTIDQAERIKERLDIYKVPYALKISGSGFHFTIPYSSFPAVLHQINFDRLLTALQLFITRIADQAKCPAVDLTIFDNKRLWKTPYSVDCKNWIIAYPLSDEEFKDFDEKNYKLEGFNKPVYKRGLLLRPGSPEGFQKLFEDLMNDGI